MDTQEAGEKFVLLVRETIALVTWQMHSRVVQKAQLESKSES